MSFKFHINSTYLVYKSQLLDKCCINSNDLLYLEYYLDSATLKHSSNINPNNCYYGDTFFDVNGCVNVSNMNLDEMDIAFTKELIQTINSAEEKIDDQFECIQNVSNMIVIKSVFLVLLGWSYNQKDVDNSIYDTCGIDHVNNYFVGINDDVEQSTISLYAE